MALRIFLVAAVLAAVVTGSIYLGLALRPARSNT
jgi:hypothetical protein